MKLSSKDLLIMLGIVVAVIITLTTWVYSDASLMKKADLSPAKKTTTNQITSKIITTVSRPFLSLPR